jgi:arginase
MFTLIHRPYDSGHHGTRMGPTEIGTTFALQHSLADAVRTSIGRERFPLVLAGNYSSTLGTVSGVRAAAPNGASPIGVLWLDAHADFNTPETTTSGFLDGMAPATMTGRCWQGMTAAIPGFQPVADAHVVLVAARGVTRVYEAAR